MAISPISAGRVSGLQIQQQLLTHLNATSSGILNLEQQLASGIRLTRPSDDAGASVRAIRLQRVLEQKEQARINLNTSNSFLAAAETSLSSASQLLLDARGLALTASTSTASLTEREAAAVELERIVDQLLVIGNQQFRGRYLFSGADTGNPPFERVGDYIVYNGNEGDLPSYVDLNYLLNTNFAGSEIFGATSQASLGTVDLNPIVTEQTRLSELNGGSGVSEGSIVISDGTTNQVIDLTGAATLGDVKRIIESNAPAGRTLSVDFSPTGLIIDIDDAGGGNLTIGEVQGGRTAAQLGILHPNSTGTLPISGGDLNPRLNLTTSLDNILGTVSNSTLAFAAEATLSGFENFNTRIDIKANTTGLGLASVGIQFVGVDGLGFGNETANYDAFNKRLVIQIDSSVTTTAANVAAAISNEGTFSAVASGAGAIDGASAVDINVTAATASDQVRIKSAQPGTDLNGVAISIATAAGIGATPQVAFDSGANTLTVTVDSALPTSVASIASAIDGLAEFSATANSDGDGLISSAHPVDFGANSVTAGGTGEPLDKTSGIQITNGGELHTIDFQDAETIDDLLNILNDSGAAVIAEINDDGTGINVRSRLSGSDFTIGENGGATATQLGIRTFSADTKLADLNYGEGVHTIAGDDFYVVRNDYFFVGIDVSGLDTVGEVIDAINQHPDNQDPSTAVLARLTSSGNGIELLDPASGGTLTLARIPPSNAVRDLGLMDADAQHTVAPDPSADPQIITGRDVNPQEAEGVFNSLLRMISAVRDNDLLEIERTIEQLDVATNQVNYVRAEVGIRAQSLDSLSLRLDIEEVQLRDTLSQEIDVDFVQAVSDLTAQQAALQASLELIGRTFQLSLFDFL